MRTTHKTLVSLIVMALLAITLVTPTLAEAGRGHHHGHGHHQGHRHNHQHQHGHHHHRHHMDGYYIYNQPRGYYRPNYYPRPRTHLNYYSLPAYPAYGFPPNVMMGIDTGGAGFMLRY